MKKNNPPVGEHLMVVQHVKSNGSKLHIFLKTVHLDAALVQRTFTQGTNSLGDFTEILLGKRNNLVSLADSKRLIGKFFIGLVLNSQSPGIVNLAKVIRIVLPEDVLLAVPCNPILNRESPVIERESASKDNKGKKKGETNDRQTITDLP